MALQAREQRRQRAVGQVRVAVEEHPPAPLRAPEPVIARGEAVIAAQLDQLHLRKRAAQRRGRPVRRAVVHDDAVDPLPAGVVAHGLHAAQHRVTVVVRDDDDGAVVLLPAVGGGRHQGWTGRRGRRRGTARGAGAAGLGAFEHADGAQLLRPQREHERARHPAEALEQRGLAQPPREVGDVRAQRREREQVVLGRSGPDHGLPARDADQQVDDRHAERGERATLEQRLHEVVVHLAAGDRRRVARAQADAVERMGADVHPRRLVGVHARPERRVLRAALRGRHRQALQRRLEVRADARGGDRRGDREQQPQDQHAADERPRREDPDEAAGEGGHGAADRAGEDEARADERERRSRR